MCEIYNCGARATVKGVYVLADGVHVVVYCDKDAINKIQDGAYKIVEFL